MWVVVDCDDDRAILHTSNVLDLTRDTTCDVEFRTHSNTCLTDLALVFAEACIDSSTRSTYLATEHRSQVVEHIETFGTTHTITTSYDDWRTFDVQFRFFHVAFDNFYYEVLIAHIFRYFETTDFAFIVSIEDLFFHHTLAHCCHLWTALWVDDSSHDVTTESWTNLIKKIIVFFVVFLIFELTNFEHSTVGSQTAEQRRRYARTKVATNRSCTKKCDLWLFFFEEVNNYACMRESCVIFQSWVFGNSQTINAVREYLLAYSVETITDGNSLQLTTQFISQSATFSQKFKTDLSHLTIFYFEIYKYVLHNSINV